MTLLEKDKDPKRPYFRSFEEAKARITMNPKMVTVKKKKDKMMKKLKDQFGDEEGQTEKGDTPLQITQGKGENEEDDLETKLKDYEPKLVEITTKKKKETPPKRKSQAVSPAPKKKAKVTRAPATRASTRVTTK